jgi:DNA-binding PadR family transcriptional regulator
MFDTGPRLPSGKELMVLAMLSSRHEMYGLEMVKASNRLARGTVYVLLGRMEEKGYISSRQVKVENASGMPRRVYRMSGLGQQALAAAQQAQAIMAAPAVVGA